MAASQDAVLLPGPLYHLAQRSDRVLALSEARRIVRPGGTVLAGATCRFASLLAAVLAVEQERSLLGIGSPLMAVGTRA